MEDRPGEQDDDTGLLSIYPTRPLTVRLILMDRGPRHAHGPPVPANVYVVHSRPREGRQGVAHRLTRLPDRNYGKINTRIDSDFGWLCRRPGLREILVFVIKYYDFPEFEAGRAVIGGGLAKKEKKITRVIVTLRNRVFCPPHFSAALVKVQVDVTLPSECVVHTTS